MVRRPRGVGADAIAGLLGVGLIAVGVGMVYLPAALVVVGALLVLLAIWGGP